MGRGNVDRSRDGDGNEDENRNGSEDVDRDEHGNGDKYETGEEVGVRESPGTPEVIEEVG